ncbi:MAG: phosphoribosylanthranilate isomerase [Sedimentisphaerales bacterium]|nr:phosphoribosylanthranilate isomerase [Sedimentisphaerales bacterium]
MRARIKICGITNRADGLWAAECGADLLGFNFYPSSPRYIEPAIAADIIGVLPADGPERVGLFVNAGLDRIAEVLRQCPLTMLQLHGDEDEAFCREAARLGLPLIKALRLRRPEDIRRVERFETEYILLDAFGGDLYGGTGRRFDWGWVRSVGDKKVFLAGGIGPETIKAALAVGTYGIDLCSGVESEPGRKDPDKVKLLFDGIRAYHEQR